MVKNQREKKMRAAIDGSASLIRIDAPAFVCVLFMCVCSTHTRTHARAHSGAAVFDLYTRWQSSGHIAQGPFFFPLCVLAQEHIVL